MFRRLFELVFGVDRSGLKRGLDRAQSDVRKFGRSTTKDLKKAFSPLTGLLTVTGITAALTSTGKRVLEYAGGIRDFAKRVGVATDFLQAWNYQAQQNSINQNSAQTALQRFMRRLGEARKGYGEMLKVVKEYDIALTDENGNKRDALAILADYAEVIRNAADEQEQLAIATKAFDTEGAGLITWLSKGKDGFTDLIEGARAAGQVLDDEMVQRLADADANLKALQNRFTVWAGGIAGKLLEDPTEQQQAMQQALKEYEGLRGPERAAADRSRGGYYGWAKRRSEEILKERMMQRLYQQGQAAKADADLEASRKKQAGEVAERKAEETRKKKREELLELADRLAEVEEANRMRAMTDEQRLLYLAEKRAEILKAASDTSADGMKAAIEAAQLQGEIDALRSSMEDRQAREGEKLRVKGPDYAVSSLAKVGGGGLIGPASGGMNSLLGEAQKQSTYLREIRDAVRRQRPGQTTLLMK